jgi:hypothetical protein
MPQSRVSLAPEPYVASSNAQRLGVLFVHGVGQTRRSDTLIDFGNAFAGWVARWEAAQHVQPRYAEVELSFTPYDAGSDRTVAYAEFVAPGDKTWVMAEAWWANSLRPLPFSTMLGWSFGHLALLIGYLFQSVRRRLDRLFGNPSQYDAGRLARLVDILTCLGLIVLYPWLGTLGYVLLVPIMVIAQIPYPPLQDFVLLTLLRPFLQYNAADLRLYIEDEIQAANMRRRVADAVDWLTHAERGNCESVVIVAHSGGSWVVHGMLTDPTYAEQRARVRKLITLGSGLNKIWQLAPRELERVRAPLQADIFWVDFWASYDPVPTGWLEPPQDDGGWFPIYEPSDAFAHRHDLRRRVNPKPPDQERGWNPDAPPPPERGYYWPESIRVVNFMDALTDHGGYFENDEEVLRRVAAEIDADLYQASPFWTGPHGQAPDAIPRRRSRVAWLGGLRVVAVLAWLVLAYVGAEPVAEYAASIGPVAVALSAAREVQHMLEALGGPGAALVGVWRPIVAVLLLVLGAALVSLAPLAAFEVFRGLWERNDRAARDRLLGEDVPP